MEIPAKPSSKYAVACVGDLVGGAFVGCPRTAAKFVVGLAPEGFGKGEEGEDAAYPSVKVCGVCSRHLDTVNELMEASSPKEYRTEPMVFTVNELLPMWGEFFADLLTRLGGDAEWNVDYHRIHP